MKNSCDQRAQHSSSSAASSGVSASSGHPGERLRSAWSAREASLASPAASDLSLAKSLSHYCAQGAWDLAALSVRQGARADMKDSSVKSKVLGLERKCLPIQMAAYAGEAELLEAMLRSGASSDASNGGEPSRPLALALWEGQERCVRLLIQAGASLTRLCPLPGRPAESTYAPLLLCVSSLFSNTRKLMGAGVVSDAQDQRLGCIRALAEAGVDLDQISANGFSALSMAVFKDEPQAVALLIELGARFDRVDKKGRTLISMALEGSAARALGELINAGARLTPNELNRLRELPGLARTEPPPFSYFGGGFGRETTERKMEAKAQSWEACLANYERQELSDMSAPQPLSSPRTRLLL